MFKKSIFIIALFESSSAFLMSAHSQPLRQGAFCDASNAPGGVCVGDHVSNTRDHRCPASQGGNCVGPEPVVVVPPPPQQDDCNPQFCDTFGPHDPKLNPHPRLGVIVDPINMGSDAYGISCSQGRKILRRHGYYHVHAVDCSGDMYSYEATRNDEILMVDLDMAGNITELGGAP